MCLPCWAHWDQDIDYYCTNCQRKVAHKPYNGVVQPLLTPQDALMPSRYPAAQTQTGGVVHEKTSVAQPASMADKGERKLGMMDSMAPYKGGN